ncbi:hypothetical protein F5Y00DRAFT_260911 [Daldinia vernicosa]|uniref:uncharacterized protein n=1 Tax=Daldinia vernicosa TaxID=114800 RepID=UPI0020085518|nr:uncharacterized protein F5Y00DRAFT_260911 [Daldinia vernicosa]KAI0850182.1 hypothetical protein F5Y00DRAFT_260911 [Daldinia vernicosa]
MSPTGIYTAPGAYCQTTPWYQLSSNSTHRPFGTFSRGRGKAPPSFGPHPEEIARLKKEAAFDEWYFRMVRSPPGPLPPPRRRPFPEPQIPLLGRFVLSVGRGLTRCADRVRAWRDWAVRTHEQVKQDYARVAFAAERKYWLAMTEYRKSPWPNTLRQLWYLLLMLLGLMLVAWVAWLKILAVMEERSERPAYLRPIPEYMVYSVTQQPRCNCTAINKAKCLVWLE